MDLDARISNDDISLTLISLVVICLGGCSSPQKQANLGGDQQGLNVEVSCALDVEIDSLCSKGDSKTRR